MVRSLGWLAGLAGLACAAAACGTVQSESCPALTPPDNGSVTVASFDLGATASYQCADGFVLVGATSRTCEADGAWSGGEPSCAQALACPQLAAPAHGTVEIVDGVAVYGCEPSYDRIGDPARACLPDGTWSGAAPTCGVHCPCFGETQADLAAALASGGTRTCVAGQMSGGTTQTALVAALAGYRFAIEAIESASLPGTHLACGYGCIDDAPADGVDACAALPAYVLTTAITAEQHATCAGLVVARCP